jgi:hypothetical protein
MRRDLPAPAADDAMHRPLLADLIFTGRRSPPEKVAVVR